MIPSTISRIMPDIYVLYLKLNIFINIFVDIYDNNRISMCVPQL